MFNTLTVTWNAQNIPEAMKMVRDVCLRADDIPLGGTFKTIADFIGVRVLSGFTNSEDPSGTPWAQVKRKVPPPILIRTGQLLVSAMAACATPEIAGDTMKISVPTPEYGLFHLLGTARMPARPWLGISDEMMDEIADGAATDCVSFIVGVFTR